MGPLAAVAEIRGGKLRERVEYGLRAAVSGPRSGIAHRALAGGPYPSEALSLEASRWAVELDPLHLYGANAVAWALGRAGRYAEALETSNWVLEREPTLVWTVHTSFSRCSASAEWRRRLRC